MPTAPWQPIQLQRNDNMLLLSTSSRFKIDRRTRIASLELLVYSWARLHHDQVTSSRQLQREGPGVLKLLKFNSGCIPAPPTKTQ